MQVRVARLRLRVGQLRAEELQVLQRIHAARGLELPLLGRRERQRAAAALVVIVVAAAVARRGCRRRLLGELRDRQAEALRVALKLAQTAVRLHLHERAPLPLRLALALGLGEFVAQRRLLARLLPLLVHLPLLHVDGELLVLLAALLALALLRDLPCTN